MPSEANHKMREGEIMSEDYSFEQWVKKSRSRIGFQRVNLNRAAQLTISDDIFNQHFSLEYPSVEIFVDVKQKAIGLKPSKNQTTGFLFHKLGTSKRMQTVFIRDLVIQNQISPESYPAKWSEKHQMLIFNYHTLEVTT
jgi:hypothetical protein